MPQGDGYHAKTMLLYHKVQTFQQGQSWEL